MRVFNELAFNGHVEGTEAFSDVVPTERYAGLVVGGLSIDPRHLAGLGPAYGPMPASASEGEAWSRAAHRAESGLDVALRGLGPAIKARDPIASAGLSASCCDDCAGSDDGGCGEGENFRDDNQR